MRTHIYVEPGPESKLLLGTISVTSPKNTVVFQLSPHNRLEFKVDRGDILLIDLSVETLSGEKVLEVSNNYIIHRSRPDVVFKQLRNHADLRHIQAILGHAQITSTELYTHLALEDLKEAERRSHPHGKKRKDLE